MKHLIPLELIEGKILLIRGHRVMFDSDLAELYDVTTGISIGRLPEIWIVFHQTLCFSFQWKSINL